MLRPENQGDRLILDALKKRSDEIGWEHFANRDLDHLPDGEAFVIRNDQEK